jgi:D-serine deaminase-like pyridoxal phosphate-dependent protein
LHRAEIPTPALLVDLDAMEANLKRMADFFADGPCRLRPHYKNHKCVALARRQIAHGAIGITCATLGEAEALARSGIRGILLANEIADPVQIERYVELSRVADIMVGIDHERSVIAMAEASRKADVPFQVVIDVDTGLGRCGVLPGAPALALAQLATAEGLRVRGLTGYEGHRMRLAPGPAKVEAIRETMSSLVETAELLRGHGIAADIVSAGGTGTHAVSGRFPGITEIQSGSYLLMDTDYETVTPEFRPALSVLTTVLSRTGNERLVLNAGFKEISAERGLPALKDSDGALLRRLNAEHAVIELTDPAFAAQPGDRLEIWAFYSDCTVNLHSRMYGMRGDQVEEMLLIED